VLAARAELSAQRALLVPGDTPALDTADLDALLARAEPVVIVPDRHGTGTNALLLTPPGAIAPAFGPGSCERHQAAAEAAGVDHAVLRLPSLALDVDTPEDLPSPA
jgi:2-phospho-L-lactate guanylyltransferase